MMQFFDAQGPVPDCIATKKRRQATRASGGFVAHHGVAHSVGLQTVSREIGAATGRRIRVDACGRRTNSSPVSLIRLAALTLRDVVRRFVTAQRRRSLRRATVLTLQSLDAHTLRDLGFDRSEIPSTVAELNGEVDIARARFVQSL